MTAFAGPRIAVRSASTRAHRSTTFSGVRSSLRGLGGAFRASANTGPDYADALLLGRN